MSRDWDARVDDERSSLVPPKTADVSQETTDEATADVMLELELTVVMARLKGDETCAKYFTDRGSVLVPQVVARAAELDADPVMFLHTYATEVHRKLCGEEKADAEV